MFARILVIAVAISLGACSTVVRMVDTPKQYASTDSVAVKKPAQNFIAAASQVGTSLGYEVSGTDVTKNAVQLTDNEGLTMGVLVGKVRQVSVTLTLQPGGRQIKIELQLYGNFDQANQAAAEGRVARLKTALASRFE
jgi:hypothetical protein